MQHQATAEEAAAAAEAAEPTAETVKEDSSNDLRASIEKALDAVEISTEDPGPTQANDPDGAVADDAETAPEETPEETAGPERDEQGRFKAKEDTPAEPVEDVEQPEPEPEPNTLVNFVTAPNRFSGDAKQAWQDTPEPIRAEITRAIEELEGGIQQYQADFEPYREFDKQIKANGQSFKQIIDHYTGMENLLRTDPIGGLDAICRNMGTTLQDVVQQYSQRPPEIIQQDSIIHGLRSELSNFRNEMQTMQSSMEQRTAQQQLEQQIIAFAADKPRFDELREPMSKMIDAGLATNLQEAYDMAERLNPAPQANAKTADKAEPAKPDKAAQTRDKGKLSVTGAPSSGSNPANRKTPTSARQAVDRAFDSLGI